MIQLKALLIKELKEAFRDKRALMVAMAMAFLSPIMIFVMSKVLIEEIVDKPPIYVKINGAEHAPKLVEHLAQQNILAFADVPADDKNLWDERNVTLTLPESFGEDMFDGKIIDIYLKTDYSEKSMNAPLRRIRNAIRDYSRAIGVARLVVRGIDVRLLQPVKLIEQDTSLPNSNAMMISMMLGLYMMMAAFMSGLSVAIDTSAGERERNVLEMLLCQPVDTKKIVVAKMLCASLIAAIGVILTLVLTTFAVSFVDLTKIGASFSLDAMTITALLILLLPLCLFASALQLFVAFQSKSFKEAQSTVSMIIMLPAFIPAAMAFIDDKPKWLEWLPISGQSLLMEDLFKGIPISWSMVAFTGVVTLGITAALVFAMSQKLKSEKVVLALS